MLAYIFVILVVLNVIVMEWRYRRLAARQLPPAPHVPERLPAQTSVCTCTHARSFHDKGEGRCRDIDLTKKYASPLMHQGSPPCACQLYIPKFPKPDPVPAAILPPMAKDGYDPVYVAFLEWWTEHWDPIENKLRK